MNCRVCGKVISVVEILKQVPYDVNSVYTEPMETIGANIEFGLCENCQHGQIEYTLGKEHYKDYNLLNVGSTAIAAGGNTNLRKEYYESMLQKLCGMCPDTEKLLDIGCGQGTLMQYAANIFNEVKGVEPSKVECIMAREKGCNVVNAFFDKDWREDGFSAFVSTQVLEHLPNLEETIRNAYRILKGGGCWVF